MRCRMAGTSFSMKSLRWVSRTVSRASSATKYPMPRLLPDTICCQFLITRYSRHTDRIHVILVNDSLGF